MSSICKRFTDAIAKRRLRKSGKKNSFCDIVVSLSLFKCLQKKKTLDINLRDCHLLAAECPLHAPSTSSSPAAHIRCTCYGPKARSGHRIFSHGNFVYVLGGFNPTSKLFSEMWALNLVTNRWHTVRTSGSFPVEMASFTICSDISSSRVLVFGGTGFPFGIVTSNTAYFLKRKSALHWEFQRIDAEGEIPTPGYGQAMALLNNEHYVIGGTTGLEYNLSVWKLSRRHTPLQWQLLQHGPQFAERGRYRHEVACYGSKILLFGGGTADWTAGFDYILAYCTQQNDYEKLTTIPDALHGFPAPRKCHSIIVYEGSVYVIGGCTPLTTSDDEPHNEERMKVHDDVWRMKLGEWRWQKLGVRLKKGVFFHDATATEDGCVVVFGGCVNGSSFKRTNATQCFWLKPPRLEYFAQRKVYRLYPSYVDSARKRPQ